MNIIFIINNISALDYIWPYQPGELPPPPPPSTDNKYSRVPEPSAASGKFDKFIFCSLSVLVKLICFNFIIAHFFIVHLSS